MREATVREEDSVLGDKVFKKLELTGSFVSAYKYRILWVNLMACSLRVGILREAEGKWSGNENEKQERRCASYAPRDK